MQRLFSKLLSTIGLMPLSAYREAMRDRDRAQRELKMATYRMWEIFERSPIGMALVTRDGRPRRVNDALCQMLGYSAEELTAMSFTEFTHPDDITIDLDLYQSMLRGERHGYEIKKRYVYNPARKELLHGDGVIYASLTVQRLDEGRDGVVALGMVKDVTVEYLYHRRLKEQNFDLLEKNRELEALRQTVEMIAFGTISGRPADVLAQTYIESSTPPDRSIVDVEARVE